MTNPVSTLLDRAFAAMYDRLPEDDDQAARRTALLAGAAGRVVELGAGTGLNLRHLGPDVTELVLTEPAPPMAARLRGHLERARAGTALPGTDERPSPVTAALAARTRVLDAPADALPLPDGSVDVVVATLVLCTVPDVGAALREAERVLRPGGRLLFLEHVRAPSARLARTQDVVQPAWGVVARGCHCNRDTLALLEAGPLVVERVERYAPPGDPAIIRPRITGSARRTA